MRVNTFYRCAIWFPILVPTLVAGAVHGAGVRPRGDGLESVVQILLASGIYGGVPYAALALWTTFWIDHRPEAEIRRRALRAPLLMVGAWTIASMIFGVLARSITMFVALVGVGSAVTLVLGYAYVALVLLLRDVLGRMGVVSVHALPQQLPAAADPTR